MAVLNLQRLLAGLQLVTVVTSAAVELGYRAVATDLERLVKYSTVGVSVRQRWSEFDAPVLVVIVNATCESDIKAVVKYCSKNKVPFLPQNGGNGWTARVGGGAIISDVVAAADAAGVLVQTGNCNCVGALGAGLGGGYGNLIGELGMAVDNILSLRVITAAGEAINVSPSSNPDLWWAMRGAGPNFGIVTHATYKAVPTTNRNAWLITLTFNGSRVAEIAQAVENLPLLPKQVVFFILSNSAIMVTGFLRGGTEEAGRKAFAPLYALSPLTQSSHVAPYTNWNAPNEFFCARGDRKPAFATALPNMKALSWPAVWDLYDSFQKLPGAQNSAVLIERYNLTKAQSVGRGATAVHDELRFNSFGQAVVIPWYKDAALDGQALDFASKVRDIWSGPAGGKRNPAYINFAHGDEDLAAIYGSSLPRLQELKKRYDPNNVFGQWFSLA
ncbi:hypothetical protein ACKVV7_000361 [Pyricularia oryzae]